MEGTVRDRGTGLARRAQPGDVAILFRSRDAHREFERALEARGIPRDQALRLLVFGFFREILVEADLPGVEDRALAHIEREIASVDVDAVAVSDAALREELA